MIQGLQQTTAGSLDVYFHLVELIAVLGGVIKVVTDVGKIRAMFQDFPMHRHVNGKIIYPKGYEPSEIEQLTVASGR
jgi:hypothetical protein